VGIAALRAALMVTAALAFFHAASAMGHHQRSPGRELVAQFQLPSDAVTRYAALANAVPRDEAVERRSTPISDAVWVGPEQQVGFGRNPYKLVLTVSGVARNAGDVRARWQAGWEVRESATATREVLMSVGTQFDGDAAAGAPVTLTAVSAPLSFRGERHVSPMLNLVQANNFDIHDVRLQVWSGSAPLLTWPAWSAAQPGWLGLGALCLSVWFFLRRSARPLAAPVAVPSRLPRAELQALPEWPVNTDRASETPTPPAAVPVPQNPSSRVVSTLRDVLMHGLVVPTELDDRHRHRAG
jgi:hypothetical protein